MFLSARILGKHVADRIRIKNATPILAIGRDVFYRHDLATISCFNFMAAANLSNLIATNRELAVRDTRELFEKVPPSALILPGLGPIAIAVLGAAFESRKIGGDAPLEAWAAKHRPKDAPREFITFDTMKHAEAKRAIGEKKARRKDRDRTHARRDQAQRLRGDRHIERQERRQHVQ